MHEYRNEQALLNCSILCLFSPCTKQGRHQQAPPAVRGAASAHTRGKEPHGAREAKETKCFVV